MHNPTSPTAFLNAFIDAAKNFERELLLHWRDSDTKYTATIRKLLPEVSRRIGLKLYNKDYYTLDAIFYREKDIVHFQERYTYAKYIVVAFEHENKLAGSESEINKLQLFSCPLKVLVTYANTADRDNYLKRYASIIGDADIFGDISTLRRQLVIFGEQINGQITWHGYVYRDSKFIKL